MEEIKKETAPEVPVQEQYVGKCKHCSKENKFTMLNQSDVFPSYCMNCGKKIKYARMESYLHK